MLGRFVLTFDKQKKREILVPSRQILKHLSLVELLPDNIIHKVWFLETKQLLYGKKFYE